MITGTHAIIRAAEPDDATYFHAYYDMGRPRAALLDLKREPILPTREELRELLTRKEINRGALYAIEDKIGIIQGFGGLRGMGHEANFAELTLMFQDDALYGDPIAAEALAFLTDRGFGRLHLNKLAVHCLSEEVALRAFLLAHGFLSEGAQREALFAGGRWHHLESLALLARDWPGQSA